MDWKPYIIVDPKILNGKAHIKDTQIPVESVLKEIAEGITIEEVIKGYPSLNETTVKAALSYAAQVVRDDSESL